jgi:hypothetical protein
VNRPTGEEVSQVVNKILDRVTPCDISLVNGIASFRSRAFRQANNSRQLAQTPLLAAKTPLCRRRPSPGHPADGSTYPTTEAVSLLPSNTLSPLENATFPGRALIQSSRVAENAGRAVPDVPRLSSTAFNSSSLRDEELNAIRYFARGSPVAMSRHGSYAIALTLVSLIALPS